MGLLSFLSGNNNSGQDAGAGDGGTLSPGVQGLLALSMALQKAGEPTRIPVSNSQALMQAVNSALPAYAAAQSRQNVANALQKGDLGSGVNSMLTSPDPQLNGLGLSTKMNMLTPQYQINQAVMRQMLNNGGAGQPPAATPPGSTGTPTGTASTPGVSAFIQKGTVTGDPLKDLAYYANDPKGYFEALAKLNMPTDLQKNIGNPATQPYVAKDQLVPTAGGMLPATSLLPPTGAQPQPNAAPLMPPQGGGAPAPAGNAPPGVNGIPPIPPAPQMPQFTQAPPGATPPPPAPSANILAVQQQPNIPPQVPQQQPGLPNQTIQQMNDPVYQKQREGLISGDQKYLNDTLLPAKDAAQQAIGNIDTIQQAAAIANNSDLTRTGPTAPARIEFVKHLNDFLASTGGEPLRPNEIANADAINKVGIRLTANMTKMLGSREAAQIFTKISEANPSWYMQPQTLNLVSNLIKQDSQNAIDKYKAGYNSALRPGGLAQDGVNQFEANNPPSQYVKQAYKDSGMLAVQSPDDPNFKLLPKGGRFFNMNPASPSYGQQLIKQ